MRVILLESIRRLGGLGDLVNVKPGFARNFLIPQGKAEVATEDNMIRFEAKRAELEKHAQESKLEAQARAERLQDQVITISVLASPEGRLYGSVTARDIQHAIKEETNIDVDTKEIHLENGAIHALGEHQIHLRFYGDTDAQLTLSVLEKES